MPLLLIFGARGTPEGSFRFDTVVKLSPRRVPVAFRSYVRPVERVPVTFASLIRLRSNRLPVAFRTYVALRPAQAPGPALPPGTPVQVVPGGLPVRWRLSCPLGHAVQGSYQHDGDSETATLTIRGKATPSETLPVSALVSEQLALVRTLTVDPHQREEVRDRQGVTTTLRLYNPTGERARTFPLPELVVWHLYPHADAGESGVPLRSVGVGDLVRRGFAAAGVGFSLVGGDPFAGTTWEEKTRDYSTAGKTAAGLFGDTYGALGYRLVLRGTSMFGLAPGASLSGSGETFTPCQIESLTTRTESAQVPGRIRVSAADRIVQGPLPQDDDAPAEDDADLSWNRITPTAAGFTVDAGYVFEGIVRETQQVEIGRVEVTEAVDVQSAALYGPPSYQLSPTTSASGEITGYNVTRVFERVLISDTRTLNFYHPQNLKALVRQEIRKRGYGYGLGTQTQMVGVVGQMFGASLPGGDLIEDSTEAVTQVWYESGEHAGTLASRHVQGRRLISVEQEAAEDEPDKRGPVKAREYVGQADVELYRPIGKQWHRSWWKVGGGSLPVYDAESQEAVRLGIRTGTQECGSEVMDNEPARVEWPELGGGSLDDEAPQRAELSVPQRAAFAVSGGGMGAVEQDYPMLTDPARLPEFARLIAAANGPRRVEEAQLKVPKGALPGSLIRSPVFGVVESLSITIENGKGTASLTAVEQTVPELLALAWPAEPGPVQGFVKKVEKQTVTVQLPAGGTRTAYLSPKAAAPAVGTVVSVGVNSKGQYVIGG